MIPNSGKASVHVMGVGLLLLHETGMQVVRPDVEDPKTHQALEDMVALAFDAIDGTHMTVQEAIGKLPGIFMVPKEAVSVLEIFNDGDIKAPDKDTEF